MDLIFRRYSRQDPLDLVVAWVAARSAEPVFVRRHLQILLMSQQLGVLAGNRIMIANHISLVFAAALLPLLEAVVVEQAKRVLAPGAAAYNQPTDVIIRYLLRGAKLGADLSIVTLLQFFLETRGEFIDVFRDQFCMFFISSEALEDLLVDLLCHTVAIGSLLAEHFECK